MTEVTGNNSIRSKYEMVYLACRPNRVKCVAPLHRTANRRLIACCRRAMDSLSASFSRRNVCTG